MTMTAPASRSLLAAGFILLGMASISLVDQFIAFLRTEASVWQFFFVRGGLMLAALLAFSAMRGLSFRPQKTGAVLLRSLLMSLGLVVYFGALGFVSVATAAAGLFTSPIFVLLISALVFRQKVGIWRISAVALGFFGVIFALTPGSENFLMDPLSLFDGSAAAGQVGWVRYLPAIAGLFYGISVMMTRRSCAGETTMTLLVAYIGTLTVMGGLVTGVLTLFPDLVDLDPYLSQGWVPLTGQFWFWVVIQAAGSLIGIVFLTLGYQSGEASYVTIFEYSGLIFSAFFSWVVFREVPTAGVLVGLTLIICAGVVIALRSRGTAQD
ncbi:DMT family transporter [Halocynthiibacter sp.]|uniref:DMT family transporter n=1 Tax=Halocynthiibacter sp. TaxID=1979210 RepID=UPI003C4275DD